MTEKSIIKKKFLLLDDRNIHSLDGAQVAANEPVRHPENPVFSPRQGLWDASKNEYGVPTTIMWDEDQKLFRAWYVMGATSAFAKGIESWQQFAYATSPDGLNWEKPELGQVEWQGSKKNNFMAVTGGVVIDDPSEVIPERRFKLVFTTHEAPEAGMFCPICIAYSPDGLNWTVPRLRYSRTPDAAINRPVNPVIPEGTDALSSFSWYWDPYIRRYVGMTRPFWNIPRRICMSESTDFVNWTPRKVVIEPDENDPPQNQEFHGMHVMRYEDYWIGFMQVYHTLHEGWYDYHEIEPDQPKWMNTFSLQLTYSRDGRNWMRCGNRQTFMSPADPGGDVFDASLLIGVHRPFIKDGKIWIYYHGCPDRHTHVEHQRKGLGRATGLAQLRMDGFVSVDADQPAAFTSGRLDMIPSEITVNASTGQGGSIRVEALDPFCRPIEGFGVNEAVPFKGDEQDASIGWKNGKKLSDITDKLFGGIRLKFYMEKAKIYSFTLIRQED